MSGSGISWAVCKSAPHSRQITMPAPHYSFLQAGCPSCRRTNSVKALQANRGQYLQFTNHCHHFHNSRNTITICQNTKGTRWPQPQKNYPLASSFLGPTNYLLREAFKILKVRLLWAVWLCLVHTHTHTRLTALFPGLPGWAGTRKVKSIWILLKQETVSGSGISWAICKSAPCSRQITTPAPHHSVFYRPDALPVAQPTASKHWRPVCKSVCLVLNNNFLLLSLCNKFQWKLNNSKTMICMLTIWL